MGLKFRIPILQHSNTPLLRRANWITIQKKGDTFHVDQGRKRVADPSRARNASGRDAAPLLASDRASLFASRHFSGTSVIWRMVVCAVAIMAGFMMSKGGSWKCPASRSTAPSDNGFVTRPTKLKSWAGSFLPILAQSPPRFCRDSMCW